MFVRWYEVLAAERMHPRGGDVAVFIVFFFLFCVFGLCQKYEEIDILKSEESEEWVGVQKGIFKFSTHYFVFDIFVPPKKERRAIYGSLPQKKRRVVLN